MAEPRVRKLPGTGDVIFDTRFSKKAFLALIGNVNLTFDGIDEGDEISLWITQDATGNRTLTIVPPDGVTMVVVGTSDAIASAASTASKMVVALIESVFYIEITAQGAI
jgi:hypothetical protein